MAVSGYLFYYLKSEKDKYREFGTFAVSKAKRLLLPFCVVGMLWGVPLHLSFDPNFKDFSYLEGVVKVLSNRIATNLWFLPTLFVIFVLMWFIVEHEKNNKIYVIIVTLAFCVVNVLSIKLPSIVYISNIAKYLIFFQLGCLVRKYRLNSIDHKYELVFFISQFLVFINSNPVLQLISSACSVLFFFLLFTKIIQKNTEIIQNKIIRNLDSDSFGIYLFHPSLIYPILYYFQDMKASPILISVITFSVILLISILITEIIKSNKYTRMIIGA